MTELIKVMAPKVNDRVVLWEVHPDHPDGEVWVVASGQSYTVALTQRVQERLNSGALIRLSVESEPVPPVETEEAAEPVLPEGYETMTVAEVMAAMNEWTESQTAAVREYETAHKGRRTILEALG